MAIEAQPLPGGLSWSEEGYLYIRGKVKIRLIFSLQHVLQVHKLYSNLIAAGPTIAICTEWNGPQPNLVN